MYDRQTVSRRCNISLQKGVWRGAMCLNGLRNYGYVDLVSYAQTLINFGPRIDKTLAERFKRIAVQIALIIK